MTSLLMEKALVIFGQKYKSLNKMAILFFIECMKRFSQEIISYKSFAPLSK